MHPLPVIVPVCTFGSSDQEEGMQPTPVFLPGESPWTGEPGGLVHGVTESQTRLSKSAQHRKVGRKCKAVVMSLVPLCF